MTSRRFVSWVYGKRRIISFFMRKINNCADREYIVLYLQLTKYRKLTNDLWSPSFRNLLKVVILLGFLPLYVAYVPRYFCVNWGWFQMKPFLTKKVSYVRLYYFYRRKESYSLILETLHLKYSDDEKMFNKYRVPTGVP